MERPTSRILRIGDWRVDPTSGEITRNGEVNRLEARTLRLLLCLAERPGEVVSIEEILDKAWAGVAVSSDSVYQAVASLRRLLGDDPKQPVYIATLPRLGYRMLAPVSAWNDDDGNKVSLDSAWRGQRVAEGTSSQEPRSEAATTKRPFIATRKPLILWLAFALCVAAVVGFFVYRGMVSKRVSAQATLTAQSAKSVAVLPFLDLTAGMKEEEFADGLTEEIIDKLSSAPGFRVPAARATFYFKYKKIPLTEIARSLGVVYVMDGSTRQSGKSVRIAVRLVRADNGFVIWSETYDRPFLDRVAVQDEIANEVTKALRASVEDAAVRAQSSP